MPTSNPYDAIVIGSGPNGLAAAIRLAQAGKAVLVIEGKDTIGGGTRTLELTLPGFQHDMCSAIHPLGLASPFLSSLPLAEHGLEWIHPDAPLAHALSPERVVLVEKSLEETAAGLGRDGRAYQRLYGPLVQRYRELMAEFLGPLPLPPRHPFLMSYFGIQALLPASLLAKLAFREAPARAIFAGEAGHAMLPLHAPATSAFGLMLGLLAHAVGWPMAKGGSQSIANAMAGYLQSLGGEIQTGWMVQTLGELPPARAILFDLTPRRVERLLGARLASGYRRQLERYRYGVGVCKVDWALSEPIPWKDPAAGRAATVHVGGTLEEIAQAEAQTWQGKQPEQPFVLLVQQSQFDSSRSPAGQHTAWAYCHVPHGSTVDVSASIEAQVERFAPGFREVILARKVHTALQMEAYNPNYIGGDINGGAQDLWQTFTRPVLRLNPYPIPVQGTNQRMYFCSSATPPGGGVHGMCGFHAAEQALANL